MLTWYYLSPWLIASGTMTNFAAQPYLLYGLVQNKTTNNHCYKLCIFRWASSIPVRYSTLNMPAHLTIKTREIQICFFTKALLNFIEFAKYNDKNVSALQARALAYQAFRYFLTTFLKALPFSRCWNTSCSQSRHRNDYLDRSVCAQE